MVRLTEMINEKSETNQIIRGYYHIYDRPIMTAITQLAIGLVSNLGLRKPPPKESPQMMLNYDARGCPKPYSSSPRTMEERRVAIGCFYVSAMYAYPSP